MAKQTRDLAFAEKLRDLLRLRVDADLEFIVDPNLRDRLKASFPGWLYRSMYPAEKRQVVIDYCGGASVPFLAGKFTRGRGSIVRVLKEVGIYKADAETLADFLLEGKVEPWYASWVSRYRKRQICAALAKEEEGTL